MKKPIEPGQYIAHEADYDEWDVYYFDGTNWIARDENVEMILCNQDVIDDYIPRRIQLKYSLDE